MSRQSIRRQIEHYGKLKSNAEKELKKLEEELELLNVFRRKYISAKSDLDYNITHRNKRLTDTLELTQKMKCANPYHTGMNETLNGSKNKQALRQIEEVNSNAKSEIHKREIRIEELKVQIQQDTRTIHDLYEQLSREDD